MIRCATIDGPGSEPSCGTTLKLPTLWHAVSCPRREYGRREPRRIDEARRVSEWARANQSNLCPELPLSWPTLWPFELCPRREWSRWEASDMDEARRVEAQER
jgi:hypothetical protein